MLPELIGRIPADEPIASVSADGVYDTWECHQAIAQCGAQAIIPPRVNAQLWPTETLGARVRNAAVGACQRLEHEVWKIWSGYLRRSLVESKMHCLKRLGSV